MTLHKRSMLLRLHKIEQVVRPRGSRKARIAGLSEADRALFEAYKQKCADWCAARPGEEAYIALLEGEYPPKLHNRIAKLIFPVVLKTDDPQQDYQDLLDCIQAPSKRN
jgi:hypothetical protein